VGRARTPYSRKAKTAHRYRRTVRQGSLDGHLRRDGRLPDRRHRTGYWQLPIVEWRTELAFLCRTCTDNEFRYESNDIALRPDEFLHAGGGDCDDFALYSAGLLRFWGWEPYLGCLSPGRGKEGHAICLSYEDGSFSSSFTYFDVTAGSTEDGSPLKRGRYVPIDYDCVGELSNAAGKSWKLTEIYVPEKAWERKM
jgi:hypothetical protein